MLDILAEILIDLFQGNDSKKKAQKKNAAPPRRNPAGQPQRRDDGWPEPSANDPYIKDHPSDLGAEEPAEGSIADIMRRMHEMATRGGEDAPVLVPGFDKPPPAAREPREQPAARKAPAQKPPPPKPPQTYKPPPVRPATAPPAASPITTLAGAPSSPPASGADYAAMLRSNPDAARQAFVFSEIFGRPLGERE